MSIEKIKAELSGTAAVKRLEALFDEGTMAPIAPYAKSGDGPAEAAAGYGEVTGCPVYAFAQNSDICSGAMSKAQAAKLKKLYELALKTGTPVIGIYDSIGARVGEGAELLTAYGELLNLSGKLAGIVPQISVILGPCEGTAALLASTADFVIMSNDGKFTINTNGEGGSADSNMAAGTIAACANDEFAAIEAAKDLVVMLPQNNLSDAYRTEEIPAMDGGDIISAFADGGSFIELYEGFAKDVKVGFARLDGDTVGVAQTCGGVVDTDGCEKLTKLVRFCDAFSLPVITIVDAEKFSCLNDASALISVYADATTAKIAVVSGTAVGAVYIALAGATSGADLVYALPEAIVSPVAPKAAAFILDESIGDAPAAEQEARAMAYVKANLSAAKAAEDGYVDDIVEQTQLREKLVSAIDMLSSKRVSTLPKKHTTKI